MLVLRVQINGESPVTAGTEDLGVLSADITAGGKLGNSTHLSRSERPHVHLTLGGRTARGTGAAEESLRWVSLRRLNIGDKVIVEVLEADHADPVESGHFAEKRANNEREYFEHCKKAYLKLRSKYEADS